MDTAPQTRFDYKTFAEMVPEAHAALVALGKAVDDQGFDKQLSELVKLRVSQINACAFCVQFHLNVARRLGIDAAKLDLVAAWRDAGLFTAREQAALGWAEQLTARLPEAVPDEISAALRACFDHREMTLLTVTIGAINSWNRIAGGLAFPPPARV